MFLSPTFLCKVGLASYSIASSGSHLGNAFGHCLPVLAALPLSHRSPFSHHPRFAPCRGTAPGGQAYHHDYLHSQLAQCLLSLARRNQQHKRPFHRPHLYTLRQNRRCRRRPNPPRTAPPHPHIWHLSRLSLPRHRAMAHRPAKFPNGRL